MLKRFIAMATAVSAFAATDLLLRDEDGAVAATAAASVVAAAVWITLDDASHRWDEL